MARFEINKGVGKPVEFNGLQAQYIWYLFGGLVGSFLLFALIYLMGVPPVMAVLFFLGSSGLLAYCVFSTGKKYGEHGLTMLRAKQAQPKYLVVRNPHLFKNLKVQR